MASAAHAGVSAVWAVNDGEKVDRADVKNVNKAKNSAWDGKTIRIFGGRNEVVAFQVIVESDDKGVEGLSLALPQLVSADGKAKLAYAPPKDDPTDYVGRAIQIFTAHYIEVKQATNCDWIYEKGSPAAPANPTGFKPVVLVPENAKAGKGGFPLAVPPNSSQAIWIEVYTPRDLPAGVYKGTVNVKAGFKTDYGNFFTADLPIELEVFDFTLPDKNSLNAMLYFESDQPETYQGQNLDAQYHRFAHRQRVELVNAYDPERLKACIGRFDGKDFSAANKYEGPGQNTGNVIAPASFYGPGPKYAEQDSARQAADAWMEALTKAVPNAVTFLYMPDEPARSAYPGILKTADYIHGDSGPGGKLPIFVTHGYDKDLAPAIDIWCSPTESYNIDAAGREAKAGKQTWVYNGKRPYAGSFVYEAPATDPRATAWGCFKHGIPLYFYWHSVHWEHNSQKATDRQQNVWLDAITFDNRKQPDKTDRGAANGDGVLLYPGQEKLHPDQDRGIAGPCGSYQLANLRRGLQDHLYLTLARELKLDDVVNETVKSVAGRMFSDATKEIGFAQTGNEFEAARYKLAQAIAKAKK